MKRRILIAYQSVIGLSDTLTGALLIIAPVLTLRLMGLQVTVDALPFLSFIGAFVLPVGLACLYGALLLIGKSCVCRLQMVWLLTGFIRASVAIFVVAAVLQHSLEAGWLTVAFTDGACVVIQAIGLRGGWLTDAAR